MSIPISINELNEWIKDKGESKSELATWLDLLGFQGKTDLARFLNEPFLNDKETALIFLQSWFGKQLFENIGNLVRLDNNDSSLDLLNYLQNFLRHSDELTILNFFKSVPAEIINLDLDGMVKVANKLRYELKKQQKLIKDLREIPYKKVNSSNSKILEEGGHENLFEVFPLSVPHRNHPLNLQIWRPSKASPNRKNLIIFMPGLGGDQYHFKWLARNLSYNGWPVILLEHPGSDSQSIKDLLEGKIPVPGLEVIPNRLSDIHSVFKAIDNGNIKLDKENLILMGHSLGALTAFLASAGAPDLSLNSGCKNNLQGFSLVNLSQLLQCQLFDISLPKKEKPNSLKAIVGLNSFGSSIWQRDFKMDINVPILLTGGSFDLVTPPISEQLELFLATKNNPYSRVLLIEGASHFSPIRVTDKMDKVIADDVFKVSDSLVGLHPISIQNLLTDEIIRFLNNLENSKVVASNANVIKNDLRFHILDRIMIKRLLKTNNEF